MDLTLCGLQSAIYRKITALREQLNAVDDLPSLDDRVNARDALFDLIEEQEKMLTAIINYATDGEV
ncbi:hypothetical protein [uncultured Dechloromonas sp.]|uniref:hypothetical protein n=1 Tax=uncultured Dechloromonas sp. TaxID=171719 RepID=UPI0025EB316C|nr:hypothetical protein [uncultured Dechloromonas sp.]